MTILFNCRAPRLATYCAVHFLFVTAVLLPSATAVPAQQCFPAPGDLVGWWPGDGNPANVQDGNDGTLMNGTTFEAGKVGQAFSFDGLDDRVDVFDTGNFNPPVITLDAWVSPHSIKSGSRIVSKDISSASCVPPEVIYALELRGARENRADFFFTTSDNVQHELVSQSVIPTGVFTHVAATYDGSEARIYVKQAQLFAEWIANGRRLDAIAAKLESVSLRATERLRKRVQKS